MDLRSDLNPLDKRSGASQTYFHSMPSRDGEVMSGWGCVHDQNGICTKVANRSCDPGMKGCVLAGRFRFTNPAKNRAVKAPDAVRDQPEDGQGDAPPEPVS
jgi:hypothetical protein